MATAYLLENVSWTSISSDFKISLSLLPVPNIKAKTFHALTSNRTKLQKVTPRSLRVLYVHLMFTKKRKSTYKIIVSAWFSVWTSQGLNLGPPDYESVALTNWATSPATFSVCGCKVKGFWAIFQIFNRKSCEWCWFRSFFTNFDLRSKILAFDKTNLNKFYLLLFSLIRTFMSFRVMKLGCIWEKNKNILLFPLIWINFSRSRKQIHLLSFCSIEILH